MTAALLAIMLAATQQPSLSLPDRRVSPGRQVVLTGAQLPAGRLAFVLAGDRDTAALASAVVPASGMLSHTVAMPSSLHPGAYRLLAIAGGRTIVALDIAVLEDTTRVAGRGAPPAVAADTHGAAHPAPGDTASSAPPAPSVPGYDWPRFHAAVNDLPAALLVFALLCELAALGTGRPSLRSAGFWSLLAGTAGMAAAAVAGLMAEDRVAHDDVAHVVMTQHRNLAIVSFALFVILAGWRVVRRRVDGRPERLAWSGIAAVAVGLLIYASQLGGALVFDHALGVPSPTLRAVLERRGDMPVPAPDAGVADSAARSMPAGHRDRPGAPPHEH